jgi:replicative DNA helicase
MAFKKANWMGSTTLKDKVPPNNLEAEAATLGAMLMDEEAISTAIQFLRADDFYKGAHRKIFQAIINLADKGEAVDLITITEELKQLGEIDSCGGASYISRLTSTVPTAANVLYYAKMVQECSVRRRLSRIASKIISISYDDSQNVRNIIEEAEKDIFELVDYRHTSSYLPVKEIIPQTIQAIETLYHTKQSYTGVPTGFPELDNLTKGFQPSELIIIGARPSVGKTALALTMAANMTIKYKKPVGFFTLEMSSQALVQRLVSSEARLDFSRLRSGLLRPSDFHNLTEAAGKIYEAPLYIEDSPNLPLLDLRALARRMRAKQNVSIIFIDYLTLITSENSNLQRHEQIAEISRSLKALARELDIPVVALSQVKREAQGGRPTLADIRESGSIEQDADVVIFLHRKMKIDRDSTEDINEIVTELTIAKQRNGPVGTLKIAFLPRYTKFESLSREEP